MSRRNIFFTPQEYHKVLTKYLEICNAKREDERQEDQEGPPKEPTTSRDKDTTVALDPLLAEASEFF